MHHQVFVYGTLLRGQVNHYLLSGAPFLGPHRTAPCFRLFLLGAYPGAVRAGTTALAGEVFRLDRAGLARLDQLEEYPRLYARRSLPTPYGRAWIYLYRGRLRDRPVLPGGDWRTLVADPNSCRAAGVHHTRDPKNRLRRQAVFPDCLSAYRELPMSEEGRFTIHLEQQEGFQIAVKFDGKGVPDLLLDEPPPLGRQAGPNASRMLAAAAADCLSASLLYCVFKEEPPANCLRAEATCIVVRNEKKRLRVGGLQIRLIVADVVKDAPRFPRCKDLFEDFCVVSASIRQGIPMQVTILDQGGTVLHQSS